jgi:hypothetical protein
MGYCEEQAASAEGPGGASHGHRTSNSERAGLAGFSLPYPSVHPRVSEQVNPSFFTSEFLSLEGEPAERTLKKETLVRLFSFWSQASAARIIKRKKWMYMRGEKIYSRYHIAVTG